MAIARRELLGIGAAAVLALATSSCREGEREPHRGEVRPRPSTSPGTGRSDLPGQPPPGSLYYGASIPYHRSLPAWENELGTSLALNRSYFTPDANETAQLVARCRDDLENGRLPHVSIKPPSTWAALGSGEGDEWLAGLLGPLGEEGAPIIFTLHHEPENDAGPPGMGASDYVSMQRRAIKMASDIAPQVIIAPVLQHWTFDPVRQDTDPGSWIVPEASVIGLDVYNPWSPTNGKEWRSFGGKLDEVTGWFPDLPVVVGEYGCREDPMNPGLAAEWLRDAADYARTHNVFSMSYFNSATDAGSWVLTGETELAFAELLASEWVARPD